MRGSFRVFSHLVVSVCSCALFAFLAGCGSNNSPSNNPPPAISVAINPTTASLSGSGVQVFASNVANDLSKAGVSWSIGTGTGTLSASSTNGITYTAPSSINSVTTVTLTATSMADASVSSAATITLNPPVAPTITSVTASCVPVSVQTNATSQCAATVTGTGSYSSTVTWSVGGVAGGNSTVGTITSAGVYTAPSAVPATNPVSVTATSTQDTTKSGSASVTVTAPAVPPTITSVAASCAPASAQTGKTSQCTATVTGTGSYSSAVTWSVGGVSGGNSTVGTITSAGVYTAPAAVPATNPVTVTATSTEDATKSGSATITITVPSPSVSVSATSLAFGSEAKSVMSPAQSLLITNTGTLSLTISSIAVSGTNSADFVQFNNCPSSSGMLSAGAVCRINVFFNPTTTSAEAGTLTITDNAPAGSQVVSLTGQGVAEAVAIAPTATTVEVNQSILFFTDVAGLTNPAVTWSAVSGTISSGGLYTAPATVPASKKDTVTVTSQADSSLSASATVTIAPVTVSVLVSPPYASLKTGGTETITASVVDTTDIAVTWSVNGVPNGNSAVGTIVTSGANNQVATYTAPTAIPATNPVVITATSAAASTQSGTATITIASTSAIVLASLDKTALAPFNLLTITGTGFNPQASPAVTFSDTTGYSVSVAPVSIGANTLVVGVPPYFSVSSDSLAAGTVGVQATETLGGSTVTSNTLGNFHIQDLPASLAPPGALTLAMLTAHNQYAQYLSNYLTVVDPSSSFDTTELNGALTDVGPSLSTLISEVSNVVANPTQTFPLGVASGDTLTVNSSELATADQLLAGELSAQAAAGYGDPEPGCQATGAANTSWDVLVNWNGTGPIDATSYNTDLQAMQCFPQAVDTALAVVGGSAAVATGGGGLLFGAEGVSLAGAAVSSQLAYINAELGFGMSAVGGALGQGSALGQQLVQAGAKQINDFLADAIKGTIISKTFGETAGNLYDLAVNGNELWHADESAPPYLDGPASGATYTLTVTPGGTGSGTIESYPGGLVCGADSTDCVVPFPSGETVYLENSASSGSTFSGYSGFCSGTSCDVTLSSDELVTATFASTAGTESVTPEVDLGTLGGCAGGTLTGAITVKVRRRE